MSALDQQQPLSPDDPLYYAPPRLRESPPHLSQTSRPSDRLTEEALRQNAADIVSATIGEQSESDEEMQPLRRSRTGRTVAIGLTGMVALAAGLALYVGPWITSQNPTFDVLPMLRSLMAASDLSSQPRPPTLESENSNGEVNEALPLGIKVSALTAGASVGLKGLPTGARVTAGARSGADGWRVGVNDLPVAAVVPPRDFQGQMNLIAELYGPEGRTVAERNVRLNWARAGAPAPSAVPSSQEAPSAGQVAAASDVRVMDPAEVAALIKRGSELAAVGDVPAARLLLQRAAETHNAQAARALAALYDPVVVKQFGVTGDATLAQAWNQKAQAWGSPESSNPMDALAKIGK